MARLRQLPHLRGKVGNGAKPPKAGKDKSAKVLRLRPALLMRRRAAVAVRLAAVAVVVGEELRLVRLSLRRGGRTGILVSVPFPEKPGDSGTAAG